MLNKSGIKAVIKFWIVCIAFLSYWGGAVYLANTNSKYYVFLLFIPFFAGISYIVYDLAALNYKKDDYGK